MRRGFQIGRLFGTDIFMSPNFLLLLAFYFLTSSREHLSTVAVFAVALILSLLVHEFGHVTAVRTLLRTDCWILLWAMGGLCIWKPTGDDSPRNHERASRLTGGQEVASSNLAGPTNTCADSS